jgi:ABC-2 type transport system ATP-binding protein
MVLSVQKLSKRYDNIWALRDVSFETSANGAFGIFGSTGSGKTSLLKCIAGLEKFNGGSVLVNGRDVSSLGARSRGIYFAGVERETGLTSLLGGGGAGSAGEGRIRRFRERIVSGDEVLFLDEPFAGIDAARRDDLSEELRALAAEGRTVVFASSDFGQIAAVCDRMAVIEKGEVRQDGFTQQVYENPDSSAVALAVGRYNLFQGRRLTSTNADMPEFVTIDGGHRLFAQHTEKNRLGAIDQNVTLAILPEQVSISFGASFPEDNLVKAVVTAIRFLGPTTLVGLDAGGLRLAARVFRVVGLNVGDECMVALPPHRIVVLKD